MLAVLIGVFLCFILRGRIRTWATYFHDGSRYIRSFEDMKSIDHFAKMTGAEWMMFLQHLPVILQDDNYILSPTTMKVVRIAC